MRKGLLFLVALLTAVSCSSNKKAPSSERWSSDKAWSWREQTGWRSGCDYIPATAINQIEMWQKASFDPQTIDKELGWAQELGFNTMRVYLSSVVWKNQPITFKANIDHFLAIASSHGIKPLFVFFDDCWNPTSAIGPQPVPKPGIHNSGWVRDPSDDLRKQPQVMMPLLESYVKDILTAFKDDDRILMWDLYNEPGNNNYGIASLPLLEKAFEWARDVNPSQPLTAGIWYFGCPELNRFQLEHSDIITYHNYSDKSNHKLWISFLELYNRPLLCTEYMARRNNSLFQTILPMLKERGVGAINWGFVSGKTNTVFAWDEPRPNETEPALWFHDIYRQDKTPFDTAEIEVIKQVNGISMGQPSQVPLADPFVLLYQDTYYAYGTGAQNGIEVWRSTDLLHWEKAVGKAAEGLALHKDDVWGETSFWAPFAKPGKSRLLPPKNA